MAPWKSIPVGTIVNPDAVSNGIILRQLSAISSCQHVAAIHVLICIEHLMCYAAIVAAIDGKINVT